jgi:hypothetical protein
MWILRTDQGRRVALGTLPAVLGRAPGSDVVLPHPSIAERHLRAEEGEGGTLRLVALDGAPLAVGEWVLEEAALSPGEEVQIGELRFRVEQEGEEGGGAGTRAAGGATAYDATTGAAGAAPRPSPLAPSAAPARGPAAPRLQTRGRGLPTGGRSPAGTRRERRGGLLATDLSQLGAGAKLGVALVLLLGAAALAWLVQLLVTALV